MASVVQGVLGKHDPVVRRRAMQKRNLYYLDLIGFAFG